MSDEAVKDPGDAVAALCEAIAQVQLALGNEDAGKLIHRLADDLGAPRPALNRATKTQRE